MVEHRRLPEPAASGRGVREWGEKAVSEDPVRDPGKLKLGIDIDVRRGLALALALALALDLDLDLAHADVMFVGQI